MELVVKNLEITDTECWLVDILIMLIERNPVTGYYEYKMKKFESLRSAIETFIRDFSDDDPDYFGYQILDPYQESVRIVEIYFPHYADDEE